MMKIEERTFTDYICPICEKRHPTYEKAALCASATPTRVEFQVNDQHRDYRWTIGDFILLFPRMDRNPCYKRNAVRLAKVVGQVKVRHEIRPQLMFVEQPSYKYVGSRKPKTFSKICWGHAVPFNDGIKELITSWLEALEE